MAFQLPDNLPTEPPGAAKEISYLNGLNADGSPASDGSWSYWDEIPHKWQDGGATATAGTGGGTVTYSFYTGSFDASAYPSGQDTSSQEKILSSDWTNSGTFDATSAEANVVASLTLWSDIANITFVQASPGTMAQLTLLGFDTEGEGAEADAIYEGDGVGTDQSAYVLLDTNPEGGVGDITSISNQGGEGVSTITHELGHVLGLGHGGPYNGSVVSEEDQYTAYDNRLYTDMSYIDPSDTDAAYYKSYTDTVKNTDWETPDGVEHAPTTPMAFDMLAVQQLYGASTNGAYDGGQIFGFHCNIADASKIFYDFTENATPVVTLFDYGTDNTLDLSGYSMACTVNLNQGAFSSVAGLTNNLCIAYGARIDTAIGGGGDDTFVVNAEADDIDGGAGDNTAVFSGLRANYSITYSAGVFTVTDLSTDVADDLTNIQTAQFADQTDPLCFLAGTRIRTPSGEVAIETLRRGDLVLTADGEVRPMIWLGRLTVPARLADPVRSFPIRVKAGALAENLPARDLLVSPDHALLVDDVLIQAGALVNGASIVRETAVVESFVYFHVELEDHALILAEDVPAESFVDNADRMGFDNWAEHEAIYPEGRAIEEMRHPRAKSRRQVPQRIRMALDRRAEAIGLASAAAA